MRYKDLCGKMTAAGWLSHTIVACNTDHHEGSGKKYFRDKPLLATRTGQAFVASIPIPVFDSKNAVRATVRYHDEHGWQQEPITIDHANGLVASVHPTSSRRFIAYLSDIPTDRITYDSAPAAKATAVSISPPPDIETEDISAREGTVSARQHLHRERNRAIVAAKRHQVILATGKLACSVCNFDFNKFYGEIGTDFCEVHHLRPLADANGEVETRLDDLAVVCSNCHRMIHRSHPFLTIPQLKSKITKHLTIP